MSRKQRRPFIDRQQINKLYEAGLSPAQVLGALVWLSSAQPELDPSVGNGVERNPEAGWVSMAQSEAARLAQLSRPVMGEAIKKMLSAGLVTLVEDYNCGPKGKAMTFDCSNILESRQLNVVSEESPIKTAKSG